MKEPVIIIGAGLSGTVFAERTSNVLKKQVLIVEKRDHIGGNCYDYVNEIGINIHKYGPHIFHTNYKKVWNYISKFTSWYPYKHRVMAFIDSKTINLPCDFERIEIFKKDRAEKIKKSLMDKYGKGANVPVYELLESDNKYHREIGKLVFEKVFINYSIKQWGENPLNLSRDVLKRVPVYIGKRDNYFMDEYQGIPKYGYSKMFQKMMDNNKIKVRLNTDVKELFKIVKNKIYYKNKIFDGTLIYTGPIDYLFEYRYGRLSYRSLKFELQNLEKKFYQKVAVVNYPNDYDFTRITEYKHFTGQRTKYTSIVKEYPGAYDEKNKDFSIPYYPVLKKTNITKLEKYKKLANRINNLVLIGRLAEYKYYNMDQAIFRALSQFDSKS